MYVDIHLLFVVFGTSRVCLFHFSLPSNCIHADYVPLVPLKVCTVSLVYRQEIYIQYQLRTAALPPWQGRKYAVCACRSPYRYAVETKHERKMTDVTPSLCRPVASPTETITTHSRSRPPKIVAKK